jgi:hypothetical protein
MSIWNGQPWLSVSATPKAHAEHRADRDVDLAGADDQRLPGGEQRQDRRQQPAMLLVGDAPRTGYARGQEGRVQT